MPKPWYKQFWPWFLITIPLVSMVLSFTMLNLALNTKDSLVVDDYYKQGKGINLELVKYQEAKAMGLTGQLRVSGTSLSFNLSGNIPPQTGTLKLAFRHATLEDKDLIVMANRDASGVFRATLDHSLAGKWRITVMPIDEQWKLAETVALPRSDAITFVP
ncbi:FixH family protein [Aestuariibacter halophilus]|uniref:FixH family protein n=1 Tax=Fluctibacter halophilus TaxID=226011 RepID=A0ABS8G544_9ALTE|nr:FixH family protein [Aestuariibacter halophilus]MCC2615707.1 FixH family protein [Aestuariibacter halophilus]